MTQFIEREDGESWRRVVERIAMPQGAQAECLQVFDLLVGESMTDEGAAKEALKRWRPIRRRRRNDCAPRFFGPHSRVMKFADHK